MSAGLVLTVQLGKHEAEQILRSETVSNASTHPLWWEKCETNNQLTVAKQSWSDLTSGVRALYENDWLKVIFLFSTTMVFHINIYI